MPRFVSAVLLLALTALPVAARAVPHVGQPAPDFSLPGVDGKNVTLAAFSGKPLYLNFFASWCVPCNEEAPAIGKLSAKYRARGLVVLGVNELESAQKAKEFLAKYRLPYRAVVDDGGSAGKAYGAIGLPVHVFIDRTGIVRTFRLGEMDPAEIETAIKAVL